VAKPQPLDRLGPKQGSLIGRAGRNPTSAPSAASCRPGQQGGLRAGPPAAAWAPGREPSGEAGLPVRWLLPTTNRPSSREPDRSGPNSTRAGPVPGGPGREEHLPLDRAPPQAGQQAWPPRPRRPTRPGDRPGCAPAPGAEFRRTPAEAPAGHRFISSRAPRALGRSQRPRSTPSPLQGAQSKLAAWLALARLWCEQQPAAKVCADARDFGSSSARSSGCTQRKRGVGPSRFGRWCVKGTTIL